MTVLAQEPRTFILPPWAAASRAGRAITNRIGETKRASWGPRPTSAAAC